ncbi:hypothetical protein ACFL6I_15270, partial [candidate division KSB1 bacterium]
MLANIDMPEGVFLNNIKYLSSKEAGNYSGYTHDYVSRLCRDGKVPGKKVGKAWFVEAEPFFNFLKEQKNKKVEFSQDLSSECRKAYKKIDRSRNIKEAISFDRSISGEFFQKTFALALATSLVFGTYLWKDSEYAKITFETSRGYVEELKKESRNILNGEHNDDLKNIFTYNNTLLSLNVPRIGKAIIKNAEPKITSIYSSTKQTTTQLATASYTAATNAYATSYSSVHSAATSLPETISSFVQSTYNKIITFFSKEDEYIFVNALNGDDKSLIIDKSPEPIITEVTTEETTIVQTSQTTQQPTTQQPITERIIETKETIIERVSGITESDVDTKLQQLNNKLTSEIYSLSSANTARIVNNYSVISQSNNIDKL